MIMEAMRLSLVEHEEQQRREAANREKNSLNNEDTTPISNTDAVPTASGSVSRSESHSPAPLQSSTLAPIAPAPITSMEPSFTILQGLPGLPFNPEGIITARNRSLTPNPTLRNRTPSPVPPSITMQSSNESSSNWRRRSSSPRTFNTIAAAMSAASTATAILANRETSPVSDADGAAPSSGRSSPPAPTSNAEPAATNNISPDMDGTYIARDPDAVDTPRRPPIPIQTQSYASSIFSTGSTGQSVRTPYDVLGSSSDSEFAREPLLSSSPGTPTIPDTGISPPEVVPSRLAE